MKYSLRSMFWIGLFIFVLPAFGYFQTQPENSTAIQEMNSIKFTDYSDLVKDWKLVTVRYREDSGELRFTYANDVAFKAMQSLVPKYPDGSVFAKISFITEDDPSFVSSKVPSGAKRTQYMVRNQKKYADSDGWGYALFDNNGNLFDGEDIRKKTMACIACHRLVPDRDFVFSRMMDSKQMSASAFKNVWKATERRNQIDFKVVEYKSLSKQIKEIIKGFDFLYSIQGEIQKNVFSGTLDEIVPSLVEKSFLEQAPVSLIADENNFSIVVPVKKSKSTCDKSKKTYKIYVFSNSKVVRDARICR